jgi:hypothetical protein
MLSVANEAGRRAAASEIPDERSETRDGVSFSRLLWVAPLAVAASVAVNWLVALLLRTIDPSLNEMFQLGRPTITLTLVCAILAVLVFAVIAWIVPRPIRVYRAVAVIALVLSLIPDLLLGFGGDLRRLGSTMMGPLFRLSSLIPAPPAGARPPAAAGQVLPAMPWEQVAILMLLHVTTAVVCIVILTTLTREPAARDGAVLDPR